MCHDMKQPPRTCGCRRHGGAKLGQHEVANNVECDFLGNVLDNATILKDGIVFGVLTLKIVAPRDPNQFVL
jgi:hypothetical protein